MAHRTRSIGAGAIALATGILVALPAFSSGAAVNNDLRSFQAAQPRIVHTAGNPKTEPPLHGTNPHAQGTAAVVDLQPSDTRPFSVDVKGTSNSEDIVVGRSRGERRAGGDYHGHITVAALFGNEIMAAADTGLNEHKFGSLASDVLDPLCNATGICLGLITYDSNTTATSSNNSFQTASVRLAGSVQDPAFPSVPPIVPPLLSIGIASSVANISSNGTCQISIGGSNVANVRTATAPVIGAASSSSQSSACRGQAPVQTNSSSVIEAGGNPLPLLGAGCANGTPDTVTGLLIPTPVLTIVCNADDSSVSSGTQAERSTDVYGVRNALDAYVLTVGSSAVAQVSAAQSESLAVAPAAVTPPTTTPPAATTPAATTPAATTPLPAAATPAATTPTDDTATGDDTGDSAGDNGSGGEDNSGSGAGNGSPQCSDQVDNDGDGVIDAADPGCHSDGNANNPGSYNPNDDSEANGSASLGAKQLPFTGSDVIVLGLAGALLLAAGLTLRGPRRRRETMIG